MLRLERIHARERGLTLVEVLVAFALAMLGLGMAFDVVVSDRWLFRDAGRARIAAAWANSQLSALGTEITLTPGVTEGDLSSGYHWRLAVALDDRLDGAQVPPMLLYRAELVVSWPSWHGQRSLQVATLKLAPPPLPNALQAAP